MSDAKIYVGNGKEIDTKYGPFVKITIDLDSLIREFENGHGFTTEQDKRKVKLNINRRQSIDSYGNSHSVTVDTWKPDGSKQSNNNYSQSNHQSNQTQTFASFPSAPKFEKTNPYSGSLPDDFDDSIPF